MSWLQVFNSLYLNVILQLRVRVIFCHRLQGFLIKNEADYAAGQVVKWIALTFYKQIEDQAPALKVGCAFKIFRAQSYWTVA